MQLFKKSETKPALVEPKPALIETKPALVETKPALVETKPALVETKPALVEPKPALVEPKPALVEPKPALVETKPAPSYAALLAEIAALTDRADAQRKSEIAAVVAEIRAQMEEFGITNSDLSTPQVRRSTLGKSVAPKYRNPSTGVTWTGRGRQPTWLVTAIRNGHTRDDFRI